MPSEGFVPINSSGGGSNAKFIVFMVTVVAIMGIVFLAWVLSSNGDEEDTILPYAFPTVEPEIEFLLQLPVDVRFHLQYQEQHFFTQNFLLLENCSIQMEKWYMWEQEGSDYGYRLHNQQILLVGPIAIYDLFSKVFESTSGTPSETNE